ncbi:MAG: NAD(P)-dependent alcohol dehydrogenase [Xanthomonadales bacterium]|nr:NAD(P)-dependent alcohol dehydrogenase [Xanthomonadales bacterium]
MKRRYKLLIGLAALSAVAVIGLAMTLSYESPCESAPAAEAGGDYTLAVTARCYGSPEVLRLERLALPALQPQQVRVQVRAAAVNPLDWHYLRGKPYVMRLAAGIGRPDNVRVGVDFAGVVSEVGAEVTRFAVGDEVFGARNGALAETLTLSEDGLLIHKPSNVSFAQAGAVAVAATTALQALRDHGGLQSGERVLINGASGGVGTFAVQIAKAMGANVTGVCSARNEQMVRAIGADRVIDYKRADYTQLAERYDLIIDMVGNHALSANLGVLGERGRLVMVGGNKAGDYLGPLTDALWLRVVAPFLDKPAGSMLAELRREDLQTLADWMESGALSPVVDRVYPLQRAAEAIAYLEQGHARGKVVVSVERSAAE